MNEGEIIARDLTTNQPVRVVVEDERIVALEPVAAPPSEDLWLAPALFDLQVNGYGGVDFQQDDLTLEALLGATRRLRAHGCGRWLLTLMTDQWNRLTARLRHLRALREQSPELKRAIAGWHLEGPFLSAQPGYHGAHPAELMCDPTPARIQELRKITGTDPLLLTLAPERTGAIEAIALAASLGIKVSLGHTNATTEVLREAVAAGATGFTHLGNACPQSLDRHDNILWRVFDTPGLTVSLIVDGLHVSPAFFRLVHRVLDDDAICYITDAVSAAGAPPGRYRVGRLTVEVGPDQVVRKPGSSQFAGSALRPMDGVWRAARMLNGPWQAAWRRFSQTPARFMGLDPGIGAAGGFCLLRLGPQQQLLELRALSETDGCRQGRG